MDNFNYLNIAHSTGIAYFCINKKKEYKDRLAVLIGGMPDSEEGNFWVSNL